MSIATGAIFCPLSKSVMNTTKEKGIVHVWPPEWLWKISVLSVFLNRVRKFYLYFPENVLWNELLLHNYDLYL